jgi:hypothetical protein
MICLTITCLSARCLAFGAVCPPNVGINEIIAAQAVCQHTIRSVSVTVLDNCASYQSPDPNAPLLDKPTMQATTTTSIYDLSISPPCYRKYMTLAHYKPGTSADPMKVPVDVGAVYDGVDTYTFASQMFKGTYHTSASELTSWMGELTFEPMQFGYTTDQYWTADYLKKFSGSLEKETSDPKFGPLLVVTVTATEAHGKFTRRYWFAKRFGYMAVRSEYYRPLLFNSQHHAVYTVTSVRKIGSTWLASAGRFTITYIRNGREQPMFIHDLIFQNVKLNSRNADAYRMHWRTGDELTKPDGSRYMLDPNGRFLFLPNGASSGKKTGESANGRRTAYTVGLVGLVCLLLTTAVLYWRRRK